MSDETINTKSIARPFWLTTTGRPENRICTFITPGTRDDDNNNT